MNKKLPDVPWHKDYIKKDKDDPTRHKKRCVYYSEKKCININCDYYMSFCGGSSHCEEYSETVADHKKMLEKRKKIDEAKRQNTEKYKVLLDKNKNKNNIKILLCHDPISDLERCKMCGGGLCIISDSAKWCPYCKTHYINIYRSNINELTTIAEENDVLLYGYKE